MEYKLEPISLDVEKVDDIKFPSLKERVIEKRGHVITFTLNEVEENTKKLVQARKEVDAKRIYEESVIDNIEHFHPFVKDMSEEDLLTVWMYKNSKGNKEMCDTKLAEIDKQMADDKEEVEEIKKQIPELNGEE